MTALFFALVISLPPRVQSAVDTYRNAMLNVPRGGRSVETLFEAAAAVKKQLIDTNDAEGTPIIETLPRDLRQLQEALPGLILNNEEVLLAEPNPKVFLRLARKYGRPLDVEFFETLSVTFPDGVWPSYNQQQTDVTGCTDFGTLQLVDRYRDWRTFAAKHGTAYRRFVRERLADIETELTDGTCACRDRESVIRELDAFVTAFPKASISRRVRARLEDLRRSTSNVRFDCHSG